MKATAILKATIVWFALATTALANTYGSVEPIVNMAVVDTSTLREQSLDVRAAFAWRALQCGVVNDVIAALASTGSITSINSLNTHFEVGAGGFMGATNPSYVYTIIDSGPNAASAADIKVLTDSLGYVLSQGSAFLLDADNPASFDFPANYVVLNFRVPPSLAQSAALFEMVGDIDPRLFETDSSGYTQFGRAYLSLQSFVEDAEFIAGYVQAAARFGVEYTPIVGGVPGLFQGGAAFPGNDWVSRPQGEEYLARIPAPNHRALGKLRAAHLRFTLTALRKLNEPDYDNSHDRGLVHRQLVHKMSQLNCR
jgi:hypothetical protein